ncbi:MAG TPA: hypothetical protein VE954_36685 [Oligoflexus sp.]|uniref:hypothetical protein n=1 Tax=Oligoflexus sp. TaxID=1971216 RepID=UPI002D4AEEBC|nr:hypothetical protein [Oligoflexus sp.]HYX38674.1 hypothetical protein [Oligoflexus sp.]
MSTSTYFLGGIILLLAPLASARSQRSVGLIQDVDAMSRAEAMTMSARGGSALFYNPACLIYNRFHFRLLGVEAIADKRLLRSEEKSEIGQTNPQSTGDADLKRAYDLLLSDQPLSAVVNARLIDFVIPYVGVQSFASTEVTAGPVPDAEQPTFQADITLRTGTIGGLAMRIGPLAIGYSKYFLIESNLEERLTTEQIEAYKTTIENDPSAAESIPYRDFTKASFGNADGHNIGLLYQPYTDNPSGFGIAVLNAGGSSFKRQLPKRYGQLKSSQQDLERKAAEYGLELELPEKIPEQINVGMLMGRGGGRNDILTANLALDYADAKGHSRRKAQPALCLGITVLGHAGTKYLSFLKFTLQAMVEKPLEPAQAERNGLQMNMGLTFIYAK